MRSPTTKPAATRPRPTSFRVAVVGVRGRGMSHVGGFLGKNNCEITTVCDCDEAVIGNAMKAIEKAQGKAPKYEKDIRKVVEDKDIDIVSIATPNHWHALMAIWAMQNGKDVYVEKPATHNVHEGAIMTGRGAQVQAHLPGRHAEPQQPRHAATPSPTSTSGKIGKVDLAIGLCYKRAASIGDRSNGSRQQPPATMDYDLWCGPAPLEMPRRKTGNGTVHYDWHWIWDYGNGDLGNQGVHEMDKARWGLGKTTMPNSRVQPRRPVRLRRRRRDRQHAAVRLRLRRREDDLRGPRAARPSGYKGAKVGNIWVGTDGYVVCPNYAGGIAYDKDGKEVTRFGWDGQKKFGGSDQHHFDNFVKAVRSRKVEDLNCDIREGHLSAALCHLANISYRLGTEMPIGKAEAVSDNKTVNEFADRDDRAPEGEQGGRGRGRGAASARSLTIDPKTETFMGSSDQTRQAKANAMLLRDYRKGFELKVIA